MKDEEKYRDEMRKPHIPVQLSGRRSTYTKEDGVVRHPLELWCCFYDPRADRLLRASRKLETGGSIINPLTYKLYRPVTIDHSASSHKAHRDHLSDRHMRKGFKPMSNTWCIQPETGRLFNRDALDDDKKHLLNILPTGMDGFGCAEGALSEIVERVCDLPPAHIEEGINARLASANPNADQWFF